MTFKMMFKTFKCADTNQKQPLEGLYKKRALKSFAKFRGKCLCQGLFFPATIKRLWSRKFCDIFKDTF